MFSIQFQRSPKQFFELNPAIPNSFPDDRSLGICNTWFHIQKMGCVPLWHTQTYRFLQSRKHKDLPQVTPGDFLCSYFFIHISLQEALSFSLHHLARPSSLLASSTPADAHG